MSLTDAHKDAIRKSWALVATDVKSNGVAIFLRLFRDYPSHQEMFKAFRNKSLDELASSPMLRAHGSSVVFQMSSVIDSLDDGECMYEIWKKIVINHMGRGIVTMQPFNDVFNTILAVLGEKLGAAGAFDDQTKEAWTIAAQIMLKDVERNMEEQKKEQGKA